MIGSIISNYKIIKLIGSGGMSEVYLAQHLKINRLAAIKVLNTSLSRNPALKKRFKNEAFMLSELKHPNIVTLYDYVESDGKAYLIMEYVEGIALDEYIKKISGPIPQDELVKFFIQILQTVQYAHEKEIIHRDIKPSNFILTTDNQIKILDFGISKLLTAPELNKTKVGAKLGTLWYMSPEQVKGEPVDKRSDIYSLGVTLFQMVTGQSPFLNKSSEYEILQEIVNNPLPDPQSVYVGAPRFISEVISKATQKDKNKRYQTCNEFIEDIVQKETLTLDKEQNNTPKKKFNPSKRNVVIPLNKEIKKIKTNATKITDNLTNRRILAKIVDSIIPIFVAFIMLFYHNINYENYSLFNDYKWSLKNSMFTTSDFMIHLMKQLTLSLSGQLGLIKTISIYLLIIFIILQIVFLTMDKQSIGKKLHNLVIIRESPKNTLGDNFTYFVVLRNIIPITTAILMLLFYVAQLYTLSFIFFVGGCFYSIADLLIFISTKHNSSLHDIIAKTSVNFCY